MLVRDISEHDVLCLSFICPVGEIGKKKKNPQLLVRISATTCIISSILLRRSLRENKQIHYTIFVFYGQKKHCTIPYKVSSLLITYFFALMVVLEAVLKPYKMIFCTWRVRRVCFYRWEQGKNSTDVKQNFSFQFKVSPPFLASHCRAVTKKWQSRCVGFGDFNQINCFWKVLARRGEISSEIVLIYRFNYFCSIALPVPPHLNNA